ncbi:hypothetical protein GQ600_11318 [Phytophthora cactorum]|nr:hypothetical protein GQ600_11318 [Phytophthora cactorum]
MALKLEVDTNDIFQRLPVVQAVGQLDGNPRFIQWLQYVIKYRAKGGGDLQTLNFLLTNKPLTRVTTLGTLFQSIKSIPGLETLAQNVQTHIYMTSVSRDCQRVIPAYTLHFAEHEGGAALLEKVKKLFAGNDPNGALEAASKA